MGQFSKVETDGHLMIVTINRPEVYNACHPMANEELGGVFDEFQANWAPSMVIGLSSTMSSGGPYSDRNDFDGTDVVFITHPNDRWSLDQRFLAMKRAMFTFKGK